MDFASPDTWRWIWLIGALAFAGTELVAPASFFSLPFGIGAAAASLLAFLGVPVPVTFIVFLVVSGLSFAYFWRSGRRTEQTGDAQQGVGATRLVNQYGRVIETIEENGLGAIRIEREEWRAESLTGEAIATGTEVLVTRISGLRLVVVPANRANESTPETSNQ